MNYTEIEILEMVKELLWDGKGKITYYTFECEGGTNEHICDVLAFLRETQLEGKFTSSYDAIVSKLQDYCNGCFTYTSYLKLRGVISNEDSKGEVAQFHRQLLLDQLIAYYERV